MKVEKHGNKYHVRKMIDGEKYLLIFDEKPTQKDVNRELLRLASETSQNAPKTSFKVKAEEYLTIKSNVLSPSTMRGYKTIIKSLSEDFGKMKISEITAPDVQKEINLYSATHSPKSTRNYHGFISAVLGMYKPELILRTTLPQKIKKEEYIPTSEDVAAVLKEANGQYRIVFELGCYGLRRSEVLALTPEDINGNIVSITKAMVQNEQNEFVIKPYPKTESSTRQIAISSDLAERITQQGYIYKGHPNKIMENLHRAQERAGVPQFRFHSLRHYFATEMSKILDEADWLALGGWSSPYVAKKVYRHDRIDTKTMEKVADFMGKKL